MILSEAQWIATIIKIDGTVITKWNGIGLYCALKYIESN